MSDTLQLGDVDAPPIEAEPPEEPCEAGAAQAAGRRGLPALQPRQHLRALGDRRPAGGDPARRRLRGARPGRAAPVEPDRDPELPGAADPARRHRDRPSVADRVAALTRRRPAGLRPPRHRRAPHADRAAPRASPRWSAEALVEAGETLVVEALLRNDQARLSPSAVELVVAMTQQAAAAGAAAAAAARASAQPRLHAVLVGRGRCAAAPSSSASRSRARCCRRRPATSSRWPPRRTGRTT